jgi:integrase
MAAIAKPPRLVLKAAERSRAAVWIIRDGERRISTGFAAEAKAEAALALSDYIRAADQAAAAKYRPKEGLRDPADLLVDDILIVYGRDKESQVMRPRELGQRIAALSNYFSGLTLAQVNGSTSQDYAVKRGSPSAARRELEDLGAAVTYCQKLGMLPQGWRLNIVLPPKSQPRDRWLTRDEAAKLIWAAWRYRETQKGRPTDRASRQHVARFILIGLYTGTRSGAICNAALTSAIGRGYVDLDNGLFYRRGLGDPETKKRQPTIEIPNRLLAHMRRWRRLRLSNSAVIEYEARPVQSVKKAFARAVSDAELVGVSPHTLRHTAISWAVQKGVPTYKVAKFFGLTEKMIHDVYGHLDKDQEVGDAITGRGYRMGTAGGGGRLGGRLGRNET